MNVDHLSKTLLLYTYKLKLSNVYNLDEDMILLNIEWHKKKDCMMRNIIIFMLNAKACSPKCQKIF